MNIITRTQLMASNDEKVSFFQLYSRLGIKFAEQRGCWSCEQACTWIREMARPRVDWARAARAQQLNPEARAETRGRLGRRVTGGDIWRASSWQASWLL